MGDELLGHPQLLSGDEKWLWLRITFVGALLDQIHIPIDRVSKLLICVNSYRLKCTKKSRKGIFPALLGDMRRKHYAQIELQWPGVSDKKNSGKYFRKQFFYCGYPK